VEGSEIAHANTCQSAGEHGLLASPDEHWGSFGARSTNSLIRHARDDFDPVSLHAVSDFRAKEALSSYLIFGGTLSHARDDPVVAAECFLLDIDTARWSPTFAR